MCKLFWGVELESLALSIKFMGLYGTILLLFALIIVGDLQGQSLRSSYVNTDIYFYHFSLRLLHGIKQTTQPKDKMLLLTLINQKVCTIYATFKLKFT